MSSLTDNYQSCLNHTQHCNGHGDCASDPKNTPEWSCQCEGFYMAGDNCSTFFTSKMDGSSLAVWGVEGAAEVLLLGAVGMEIVLQWRAGKWRNTIMVLKQLLVVFGVLRMYEICLWYLFYYGLVDGCVGCNHLLVFFNSFPRMFCVLLFLIAILIWFQLRSSMEMQNRYYEIGKIVYTVFGVLYFIMALILFIIFKLNFQLYNGIILFFHMIPLFILTLHALSEVISLHKTLKQQQIKDNPVLLTTRTKNFILGSICINFILLIIVILVDILKGPKENQTYSFWLSVYAGERALEYLLKIQFFQFSEKYFTEFFLSISTERAKTKDGTSTISLP